MQTPQLRHWILLAYLVLAWGWAFYLIAIALDAFQPVTIVWGRLTLGAVVMIAVLWWQGGAMPRGWLWWRRLLFLSVTGNILPFILIAWAERSVPSGEVGLLMALMPITILILGHYFLEHERLTALRVIGVLLGFAGVALLVGEDMFFSDGGARLTGQVAAVIATFCYAINGIYTKRLPAFDTVAVSAASLLTGSVLLALPMWNLQPWPGVEQLAAPWVALLVLGIFSTGAATWVYFTIVSEVGPGFLSTINYLIPALAFFVGVTLLDEPAGVAQLAALALILAGVWLIQPRRSVTVTESVGEESEPPRRHHGGQ
jgi:drug/metabolite transporter (DMT)-like permease